MNDTYFKVENVRLCQDFRDTNGQWYIQINFDKMSGLTLPIRKSQAETLHQLLDTVLKPFVIQDNRKEMNQK